MAVTMASCVFGQWKSVGRAVPRLRLPYPRPRPHPHCRLHHLHRRQTRPARRIRPQRRHRLFRIRWPPPPTRPHHPSHSRRPRRTMAHRAQAHDRRHARATTARCHGTGGAPCGAAVSPATPHHPRISSPAQGAQRRCQWRSAGHLRLQAGRHTTKACRSTNHAGRGARPQRGPVYPPENK